jgi:hypothetical protein
MRRLIVVLIVLCGAAAACGGGTHSGTSGKFSTDKGWSYSYSVTWGTPTPNSSKDLCVSSAGVGHVNIPFELTIGNEMPDRGVPIPSLAISPNLTADGTVLSVVPSFNDPAGVSQYDPSDLVTVMLSDGQGCFAASALSWAATISIFDASGKFEIAKGKSLMLQGTIANVPNSIPANTGLYFRATDGIGSGTSWRSFFNGDGTGISTESGRIHTAFGIIAAMGRSCGDVTPSATSMPRQASGMGREYFRIIFSSPIVSSEADLIRSACDGSDGTSTVENLIAAIVSTDKELRSQQWPKTTAGAMDDLLSSHAMLVSLLDDWLSSHDDGAFAMGFPGVHSKTVDAGNRIRSSLGLPPMS